MTNRPTCDLHMHTYYSDGRPSPEELVRYAARIGLKTIAITDHDNARGSREAQPICEALSLELIPAIEFNSRWDGYVWAGLGSNIDVLGYFIDLDHPDIRRLEQVQLDDFSARVAECCDLLTAAGYPMALADLLALNPRFPGVAQALTVIVNKGYAENTNAAFPLYSACWQRVQPGKVSIDQIIATINGVGGVAVLAHPSAFSKVGETRQLLQAQDIAPLVEMGLGGIEVFHYRNTAAARDHFQRIAEQFGLLVTGGSDEHALQGFKTLGTEPISVELVEALRARSIRQKRAP